MLTNTDHFPYLIIEIMKTPINGLEIDFCTAESYFFTHQIQNCYLPNPSPHGLLEIRISSKP